MLCDFHIHSTFSDGQLTIAELVDLYGKRGFGAIAITDHLCETDTFLGRAARYLNHTLNPEKYKTYIDTIKAEAIRAREQYNMLVLPGFEITKNFISNNRSAHMLALGIETFVSANDPIEDICKNIRNLGGLVIAAHPVNTRMNEKQTYHLWNRREELNLLIDAWEVASGPHIFTEVQESGLPMIANSDLHRVNQMTSWKTVLNCENSSEAVKDSIRKQQLDFTFFKL